MNGWPESRTLMLLRRKKKKKDGEKLLVKKQFTKRYNIIGTKGNDVIRCNFAYDVW